MRSTRVEIDLGAVSHNLKQIRRFTGTSIMMAIKANAYGHGAHEIGRLVEREHLVDMLGVTSIEEGIDLRDAGVTLPVLIFTLVDKTKEDIDALFEYRLTPTITDNYHFEVMVDGARRWGRPIEVHLKTDTGMGRLGLPPEEALDVLNSLSGINEIKVSGIYTHFPVSDSPDKEFTKEQIFIFQQIIDKAKFLGKDIKYMHCANSGAIVDHADSYMNMVRPGILCYGLYPVTNMHQETGYYSRNDHEIQYHFHQTRQERDRPFLRPDIQDRPGYLYRHSTCRLRRRLYEIIIKQHLLCNRWKKIPCCGNDLHGPVSCRTWQ